MKILESRIGKTERTVQRLMGHKTFTTTQRYAHHYSESLRNGIATPDQEWTHVSDRDGPTPKLHAFEFGRR